MNETEGEAAPRLFLTAPSVHLVVLPLQLGEVQRDVGVRRLDVDDPVPGEAAGRVAGPADDGRVGDRRGDLPPELPRRHRQLPRPPPLPRRRHARTHGRQPSLGCAPGSTTKNKKGKPAAPPQS